MRLIQLGVAVAVSCAAAMFTGARPVGAWVVPLTAVIARLAFDPLQFSYYWIAPLTLTLLALMAAPELRRTTTYAAIALMYCQVIAYDGAAKTAMIVASAALLGLSCAVGKPGGATARCRRLTASDRRRPGGR